MILSYLFLAHLLGDFLLQPSKLVLWKMKSKAGTLVHASVHFLLNLLLLLPFIIQGYYELILISFMISFIHFWIDEAKISYDLKHDKKVTPFLIDQLLHISIILLSFLLVQDVNFVLPTSSFYSVYQDSKIVLFFSFLILVSRAFDIYYFQKYREKNKKANLQIDTNKMLSRIIILCLLYSIFMLISFYARYSGVL